MFLVLNNNNNNNDSGDAYDDDDNNYNNNKCFTYLLTNHKQYQPKISRDQIIYIKKKVNYQQLFTLPSFFLYF